MKYAIVMDSSCDIYVKDEKQQLSDNVWLYKVPLRLRVGDTEYVDDSKLNIEEFMETMEKYPGPTGSAAASPGEWYDAFKDADEIFAVTITSALSGSYSSAMAGVNMLMEDFPEKKVHVVDSRSAGAGLTMIVRKLEELISQGKSFETIVAEIEEYRRDTQVYFILESMDNLVKNGRVNPIIGKITGMLGIKIIGHATPEGTIEVVHKVRGINMVYKKAVTTMIDSGYKGGKVTICHCLNEDKVKLLVGMLEEKFGKIDVEYMQASGLCSYYAERNGIIFCFEI
ncbi:MAG: DegV family protein [Lachnospiraceae bacterium]|nr:DegV family protein [Lachnospiraceae bacterium]